MSTAIFNKTCYFYENRGRRHTGGADYTWTVYDRSWTAGMPVDVMDHTRSEDYNHKNVHIALKIFYFKTQKLISGVFASTMKKLMQPSSAAAAACVSTSSHGCFQLDQENSKRVGGFPALLVDHMDHLHSKALEAFTFI